MLIYYYSFIPKRCVLIFRQYQKKKKKKKKKVNIFTRFNRRDKNEILGPARPPSYAREC